MLKEAQEKMVGKKMLRTSRTHLNKRLLSHLNKYWFAKREYIRNLGLMIIYINWWKDVEDTKMPVKINVKEDI